MDERVLLFAVSAAAVTTLLAGLWPALRASSIDPASALHGAARGGSGRGHGIRPRFSIASTIAQAQVALSLVLLFCAALLGRSYAAVVSDEPGFDGERVVTVRVALGPDAPRGAERTALVDEMLARVGAFPGVEAAAVTNLIPLGATVAWGGARLEGVDEPVMSEFRAVTPGFFEVMGIEVVSGRPFLAGDMTPGTDALVVDRTTVDRYWSDRDPAGLRAGFGADSARIRCMS